jgi:hypothetical protein
LFAPNFRTTCSYIIDHSYHIVALDAETIGQDPNRGTAFSHDSAWFIEDVATVTP